jgi:rhodanese-related sulfurtransferase
MRRDWVNILFVLLISSTVAAGANLTRHEMEWIRSPLPPVAPSTGTDLPSTATHKNAEANGSFVDGDAVIEHLANGTACFIDARERDDYDEGHLRGAVSLPSSAIYDNIEDVLGAIPPDSLVIVYCGGDGCEASHSVADALRRDYMYTNVHIHEKGWEEIESRADEFGEYMVEGEEP